MTNALRRKSALALAVAWPLALAAAAQGGDRPQKSSTVKTQVQGGTKGVEPIAGAPPAIEPSLASRPAQAAVAPAMTKPLAAEAAPALRAIALVDGQATLEIEGRQEVVRPGSRVGEDTVRSVTPERIVLERSPRDGEAGGSALVILTFDEAGRARTRVFWTHDPARDAEGKRK